LHALDSNEVGGNAISIGLHEFQSIMREDDNTLWEFVVVTSGVADSMLVPRGENIELAMIFDATTSEATFEYDQDFTDSSVVPMTLGPFAFTGSSTASHLLLTDFVGEDFGAANAVIDHWSLRPFSDVQGDFNGNGILDAGDIDLLSDAIRLPDHSPAFDVDGNDVVDEADRDHWIHGLKFSYYGDSNLDGEFNSRDLTTIFQAAEYEDDVIANSTWATGDWNGDREFSSSDLVRAFQDAGYEEGPRAAAVPEPTTSILWALFVAVMSNLVPRRD
jgi:hypothetical protein